MSDHEAIGRPALIEGARRVFPAALWRQITAPYWWWYNRARHQAAALIDRRLQESQQRVAGMRDAHRGERCFIIGNGPSLAQMNLSPLRNEITFGMNRIYLIFPEIGFTTSYFVSVNTLVIEQCASEIAQLEIPKFISWRARRWFGADPGVLFLDTDYTDPPAFAQDASGRLYEGSTVTYVAMQLAYHLGLEEVILIGVDHSFQSTGVPNQTVRAGELDVDHFSPDYFSGGFRWQLPDLEASERAYRMAKSAFESDGRRIVDATLDGKLDVFDKVKFDDLF